MIQKTAFAIGVPSDIYGFHPYTRYSIFLYHAPACQYQRQFQGWALGFHPWLNKPPTDALRPVNPNNACTLRITAAAGTKFAGASSKGTFKKDESSYYSLPTVVYTPKCFFPHVALLHQGSPHCAIFPTAASRRSLDRVSVPVWLVILSDQLEIIALVGLYPTN